MELPKYDKMDVKISIKTTTSGPKEIDVKEVPDTKSTDEVIGVASDGDDGDSETDSYGQGDSLPRMYIKQGEKTKHIQKALKMIIGGKDVISKERGLRHMAGQLTNHIPVPKDDDILALQVLYCSKGHPERALQHCAGSVYSGRRK